VDKTPIYIVKVKIKKLLDNFRRDFKMNCLMKIGIALLSLSLQILFLIQVSFAQKEIPDGFCINPEEFKLFNAVNDYRKSQNLPLIPLSKSLSYIAKLHIKDLITNLPDTAGCGFHSWSDKGPWKPCCFKRENKDKYCILSKPKELTNYPGIAHEVVFWESREASAEKAIKQWKETSAARFMLTNFREWEKFRWNAMGVGIEGGFAILWLGEEPDIEKETQVCGGEKVIGVVSPVVEKKEMTESLVVTSKSGRYYLIFGSHNTMKDAKIAVEKFRKEGFEKVKIVTKDNKYRISLSDYPTKETAAQGKKELPAKYKDAWIMPY
jgi:hypothetical protein